MIITIRDFYLPKFQDIVRLKFWKSWTFPNFRTISVYIDHDVNFKCLCYTWGQNVLLKNSASKNPEPYLPGVDELTLPFQILASVHIISLKYTWGLWNLPHWGRDKMAAIPQTTSSNAFSWMKLYEFRLRFHLSLFLRFQFILTIFQYWFR